MGERQEELQRPARVAREWQPEDDDVVVSLFPTHAIEDIAIQLGRSLSGLKHTLVRLRQEGRLSDQPKRRVRCEREREREERGPRAQYWKAACSTRAIRRCLGRECGQMFDSAGPGNRLCDRCREKLDQIGSPSRGCY